MKTAVNLRHPRNFFGMTFLFSWLVWGMMIVFRPTDTFFVPLLFLGAFGPSIVALFFSVAAYDPLRVGLCGPLIFKTNIRY